MPVISQRASARQTTPAPPGEKEEEDEEGGGGEGGGGNESKRSTPIPSQIICMRRIRNGIHGEGVRRESWGTKKRKRKKERKEERKKVGRETRCVP